MSFYGAIPALVQALAIEFPGTWHSGGKLKIRFTAPIIPGESVTTYGEITAIEEIHDEKKGVLRVATCVVGCKKPDGTDAVSGRATVPLE